jgi:hypothetical protein
MTDFLRSPSWDSNHENSHASRVDGPHRRHDRPNRDRTEHRLDIQDQEGPAADRNSQDEDQPFAE